MELLHRWLSGNRFSWVADKCIQKWSQETGRKHFTLETQLVHMLGRAKAFTETDVVVTLHALLFLIIHVEFVISYY
jgi:hypothetical protein